MTESIGAGDPATAQIECELVRGGPSGLIDQAMDYRDSGLRRLIIGMLKEMDNFFEHCSSGDWESAQTTRELVSNYMNRVKVAGQGLSP